MASLPPGQSSPWDTPAPVLLNPWKHHAGFLRTQIAEAVRGREPALANLAGQLVVIGTELMDLYTGPLTPAEIAARVIDALEADGRLDLSAYREWVREAGGYRVLDFADDPSRWVLRMGNEAGRYVHVHPGRWAPQTRRVRANVLKTAVLVLAYTGVFGGDPLGRALVNSVRQQYLGLAPVGRDLAGDQGVGAVIEVLRAE
ncbi:MAG TPA: hypothetical protein VFA26_05855 [Gemmataceae bacterium]|nr:hypothetical protein [Gemmataceae bacterium]